MEGLELEIFRPGSHTDSSGRALTFSEGEVSDLASGYDPALYEAPVVIGHPKSDDPAYGWVRSLRFAEGALKATLHKVAPSFAALVKEGAFRNRSASLYAPSAPGNPRPGHWYLRHLGFLGATPPAIKGLQPVAFAEGDGAVTLDFGEAGGLAAENTRLRQELTRLRASAAHTALVDRLLADGRLLPCFAEGIRQVLDIVQSQQGESVCFNEGGQETTLSVHAFLKTYLEGQPVTVHYGEIAGPDQEGDDGEAVASTADRITQWVGQERSKGRAVSFSDAPPPSVHPQIGGAFDHAATVSFSG